MAMFGIGFFELLILGVMGLLALGGVAAIAVLALSSNRDREPRE